jgi:hypothetical protein
METKQVKTPPACDHYLVQAPIRLQLDYFDFTTLYALMADASCVPSPQSDMYKKLLHHHITGIFKKLYAEGSKTKYCYTIDLTPTECLAFWLYWTDHHYSSSTPAGRVLNKLNHLVNHMFC